MENRSLRVKCTTTSKGCQVKSELYPIEYGTPQGSCLGPLIFLIFVIDLHLHLEIMGCIQFADDTTLLASHRNLKYLRFCVATDLSSVPDWFRANKLTLNIDKTAMMLFRKNSTTVALKITLNGETIPQVHATKFLGVLLDYRMSWSTHVDVIRKKTAM